MINLDEEDHTRKQEEEPLDGVVCTFWVQPTGCRKMENCEFLHPAHLKGTAKPKICRFWKEKGYCAKQSECDFIHEGPAGPNTRICKFFAERGSCAKMDQCNFSHDIEPGSIRTTKICKFFVERGYCLKEDKCDFSHEIGPGGSSARTRSSAIRSSARIPSSKICRFYADTGYCAKGASCDFFHDGPARSRDAEVCGFWMGGRCQKGRSCTFKHPPRSSERGFSPELFDRYEERRGLRGRGPSPGDRYRRRPRSPRDRDRRDPWHQADHPEYPGKRRRNSYDDRPRSRRMQEKRGSSPMFLDQEDRYARREPKSREEIHRSVTSPALLDGVEILFDREGPFSGGMKRKWDPRDQEVKPGKRIKTQQWLNDEPNEVVFAKERMEIERRSSEVNEKLSKALERVDLDKCLDAVVQACRICGEHIRKKVGEQRPEELSDLEEECNGILASAIVRKYPLHGVVAKQNAECLQSVPTAPTWFICPLEGRDNFVRGSPFVCVSIGLCVRKIPVLGVIYNPILEQLACGFRGGGVYLEEKQTQVKDVKEMGQAIIANEYCRGSLRKRLSAGAGVKSFRETGCFSQDFIDVLRGVCDGGFQEALPGPWSYCAGAALIEEAGGVVTDLQGNLAELELNKRKLVFGPRKLVEEIVRYF